MRGWRWRDALGRFAERRQSQAAAPELSPAAISAIEWLARDPRVIERLGPLVGALRHNSENPQSDGPPSRSFSPPRREPERTSDKDRELPEGDVLGELTAKVEDLTRRADHLVVRDEALIELHAEGWTEEGLGELARYMSTHGLSDARQAAKQFERETERPEPVVSGRGGGRQWQIEDRREERRTNADMLQLLLRGNDEEFLAAAIPAALREVRGQ